MADLKMFQTTPRIVMGPGSINNVAEEVKRLGAKKVAIVTDKGLIDAGIVEQVEDLLSAASISTIRFDAVEPDPPFETATEAANQIKSANVEAVLGIGGGSPLDIAKVASLLVTNDRDVSSYFGIDLVPNPGLKMIAVPTTAGTGSEVTPIAILSDHHEKLKKGIVTPYLFPAVAILDPELTIGLPPHVTAATGMDALIHAVESYTSRNSYSLSDLLAEESMRLIGENLRTAFSDGLNLEARANMLEGSLLAGIAFANAGVTAVHAFAYPIGAEFHIPHGVANSIMLASVMEFNMMGNLPKFGVIAELLGENTEGLSQREAALCAVEALRTLAEDVKIPMHLGTFGVKEKDIPQLAEGVMKVTRLLANNPRRLTLEDAQEIYRRVL
jgi:alcohol dehydrogenase class IV